MTREQYFDTLPTERNTPAESIPQSTLRKDTRRADAPPRSGGNKGEHSLNVGGTTKYAVHTLVP